VTSESLVEEPEVLDIKSYCEALDLLPYSLLKALPAEVVATIVVEGDKQVVRSLLSSSLLSSKYDIKLFYRVIDV